ncbi:MAG: hypothetical protein AAGL18_10815 [Pseudomonadota bacterium]
MGGVLGIFAFLAAVGGAIYLLIRTVTSSLEANDAASSSGKGIAPDAGDDTAAQSTNRARIFSNETIIKGIIWLLFCAALFAAKLWPLALMVLVAAGAVLGIEVWKQAQVDALEAGQDRANGTNPPTNNSQTTVATRAEAAQILGVSMEASAADVKIAHRSLISRLHPDSGGTDFLAMQINQARDLLLRDETK